VRNEGAEQSAALFDGEDLAWEMDISADAIRRLKRLESREQLSHFEIYEELTELMSLLEVYWLGQTPERQRVTARDVRDMLRRFEALKERIQNWAQKELRKRTHYGFRIGRDGEIYDAEGFLERKGARASGKGALNGR
jgi:hypothetical protein